MPQSKNNASGRGRGAILRKSKLNPPGKTGLRYSVGLPSTIATKVERYAETANASMSKAIAALVGLGLECQERRKREFFKRLRENVANDDPKEQDRMVDEFRTLILGR
jgi:hypothetical protein